MSHSIIVIADSTRCRFLSLSKNHSPLQEIHDLINESSRLPNQDLTSDSPGSQPNSKGNFTSQSHSLDPKLTHKAQQAALFTKEICNYLEKQIKKPEVINVLIIAPAKFLGLLHKQIDKSPNLKKKVVSAIDKNLITASLSEIRQQLPFSIPGHLK